MLKQIFVVIAVAMLTLGIAAPAFAVGENAASTEVPFTHTMNASGAAVDLNGIAYTISISGTARDSEVGSYSSTGVDVIALPFASGVITPATPSPAVRSDSTETTKIWAQTLSLDELFGDDDPTNTDTSTGYPKFASNFPQAGIYKFTISETRAGGSSADTTKWSYTPADDGVYTLTVWVKNDSNDVTKRMYDGWVLTDPNDDKVEVNDTATHEVGADFTSSYIANSTLNVTKMVEGEYANTVYAFPQQITLYLPDWATSETITATGPDGTTALTPTSGAGTATRVYDVDLAHGQTASFQVPVGTRYQVVEDPTHASVFDAGGVSYSPTIEWNVDNGSVPAPQPGLTLSVVFDDPEDGVAYKLGETFEHSVTVSNTGDTVITNIVIEDITSGDVWGDDVSEPITLAPGASLTYTTEFIVGEIYILEGEIEFPIELTATMVGEQIERSITPVVSNIEAPNPELTLNIVETSSPANGTAYVLGEQVTLEFRIYNTGNVTISNVVLGENKSGVTWPYDSIAPGSNPLYSRTATQQYIIGPNDVSSGNFAVSASLTGTAPDGLGTVTENAVINLPVAAS